LRAYNWKSSDYPAFWEFIFKDNKLYNTVASETDTGWGQKFVEELCGLDRQAVLAALTPRSNPDLSVEDLLGAGSPDVVEIKGLAGFAIDKMLVQGYQDRKTTGSSMAFVLIAGLTGWAAYCRAKKPDKEAALTVAQKYAQKMKKKAKHVYELVTWSNL
jgi:hypothetical protein